MKVPFVDLKANYQSIKDEVDAEIMKVIGNCAFVGGPAVQSFEEAFAEYCGAKYAVGVSSGTSALHLAMLAMGIGAGDEVITAANTFIATAEAVSHAGADVKLVDCDGPSFNIDASLIEKAITEKTKAIVPVHLYGQAADMDAVTEMAKKHNLMVLEDAAQAQGAEYKGKRTGSMGDAAAFSFYPAKNLGAYGDAGIVVTNSKQIADDVRLYANHGRRTGTDHAVVGYNARLDGIQGAVLGTKLPKVDGWNEKRREAAGRYDELLKGLDIATPAAMPYASHIYHLYVIRVKDRDRVKAAMGEKDVGCGMHYPIPVHLLDAYKHLGKPVGSYPVAEEIANELLSLPMFPEITGEQQKYVADCLGEVLG